jgi:chromosome segregation ATPase
MPTDTPSKEPKPAETSMKNDNFSVKKAALKARRAMLLRRVEVLENEKSKIEDEKAELENKRSGLQLGVGKLEDEMEDVQEDWLTLGQDAFDQHMADLYQD